MNRHATEPGTSGTVVCRRPVRSPMPIGGDELAVTGSCGCGPDHDRRGVAGGGVGERAGLRIVHHQQHGGEVPAEVLVDHAAGHLQGHPRLESGLEVGTERVAHEGGAGERAAAMAGHVAEDEAHAAAGERQRVVEVAAGAGAVGRAGRPPRCAARRGARAPGAAGRSGAGRPPGAARGAGGRAGGRGRWRRSSRRRAAPRGRRGAASATFSESGTTSTMSFTVRTTESVRSVLLRSGPAVGVHAAVLAALGRADGGEPARGGRRRRGQLAAAVPSVPAAPPPSEAPLDRASRMVAA